MAKRKRQGSFEDMPDALDPIAVLLRFIGAFYAFAGIIAGRAALTSGVLDAALSGISGKRPSLRERALTWWLTAASWTVFVSGILLMILAREAMWAFILCALIQGTYLWIAAPYYFDIEDPPDALGRRSTTNAFFIYMGATLFVIWASGHYLTPVADLNAMLGGAAGIAIAVFGAHLVWQTFTTSRMPKLGQFGDGSASDAPAEDDPEHVRYFNPRSLRLELSREGGASPVRNQKTKVDIGLESLPISDSLKSNLMDWFQDGDPEMAGIAYNLAEQLAHEYPEAAIAEPGIPNSYFNIQIRSPYADPETGAPNWDRITAVKIMCDYDCMPCWAANEGAWGDFPPSVLQISAALEDALLEWQDRFDGSLDRADPATPFWTPEQQRAHEMEGLELARRVKAERPELAVYAYSEQVVRAVDLSLPTEQWRVANPQSAPH
jgi:hypothetical protein